jgi:hypothetical protein
MTWQTYCNKYKSLLIINSELASIRQALFFRLKSNKLKSFVIFLLAILNFIKCTFKVNKNIELLNTENIYFIDSPTSANLGSLNPLILQDNSKKVIIVNNKVEKNKNFLSIRENSNYINYENFYNLSWKDFSYLLSESKKIAIYFNISFFIVFPLMYRYLVTKNALEYLFMHLKGKNLILSNDTLLASNTAIHVAKQQTITDYVLQHGFLTHFYIPTTATNYIVWGEKAKEWFIHHKAKTNVLPLGTPRLDEFSIIKKEETKIKRGFFKKYKIENSKKIFFYMSHSQAPEYGIEIHKKNFEALKTVIRNDKFQLIIKLHPSENEKLFNEVFTDFQDNIILLPKDENLHHTIVSSDICASAYSTTLIEAMCFEKPTLQMIMAQVEELPDYSKNEGCIAIETINELANILKQEDFLIEIKRQNEYVNKYFNHLGTSSKEILEYIQGKKSAN